MGKQITMFDPTLSMGGCGECVCKDCLYWWSGRCPYGECYDDYRAKNEPYDKAHPGEPPRTAWTDWENDQAHWCRGGVCYTTFYCEHYIQYQDSTVHACLDSNVQVFQDGCIRCSYGANPDCEKCYKKFEERIKIE